MLKTKVYDVLFWIFFVISIVVGLWYIFGDSPTFEQTILIFIATTLFTNVSKITKVEMKTDLLERRFDKFEKKFDRLEGSFIRLANDFKEHVGKS